MNAIVVSFDRLPESFLGCCGNSWIETPNFDRLAAQSAVFHQHFAEDVASASPRHAWWSGRYECRRTNAAPQEDWLPVFLKNRGVTVRILCETAADGRGDELAPLPPELTECVTGVDGLDVALDETPFFRLVARAQRDLRLLRTSRSEPWLLWIKSRGVPMPWLAPREFATRYLDISPDADPDELAEDDDADDDDDSLVQLSAADFDDLLRSAAALPVGRQRRDAMTDTERLLSRKVLGGYVSLLDAGLGRLMEHVEPAAASSPTLLIVTAARGIAVREPGLLRDAAEPLAEETLHAPLFVRADAPNRGTRRQELVQPVDLYPTLAEWFALDAASVGCEGQSLLSLLRGQVSEPRRFAFSAAGGNLAGIRSFDHYLVTESGASAEDGVVRRLFAKPEDIWEMNDLAPQSPDMVEDLSAELDRFFAETQTAT